MFPTLIHKAASFIPKNAVSIATVRQRVTTASLSAFQHLGIAAPSFRTNHTSPAVPQPTYTPVPEEEMPFLHFRRPIQSQSQSNGIDGKPAYKKFISPRKRANKMMTEITQDALKKAHNPKVHNVKFRVGDAIEITMVSQGGIKSNDTEKVRGVVLGIDRGGLGTGVYLRDVVFGEPVDRKIPLYSPMVKNIKLLEENFVFKRKRKVKRAKLFYLRDRLPQETRVTKY